MANTFNSGAFITAGKALFTVTPTAAAVKWFAGRGKTCKPHYTFKVSRKEGEWQGRPTVTYFVNLFTGIDNTNFRHFTYMGLLDVDSMTLRLTDKSGYNEASVPVKLLGQVLTRLRTKAEMPDTYIRHEGRCGRCGRVLTVPSSIDNGIGPECMKHVFG